MTKKHSVPRSIKRAFPNVKKIIDARHSLEVHVTSKDCKNGRKMSSSDCALAQAVKREFKADAAIIGLGTSYIIKGDKATRFETPERIGREIVSFDRNQDFAEGSYTLTRKSPSCRLGVAHTRTKATPQKNTRGRHDTAPVRRIKNARVRVMNTES